MIELAPKTRIPMQTKSANHQRSPARRLVQFLFFTTAMISTVESIKVAGLPLQKNNKYEGKNPLEFCDMPNQKSCGELIELPDNIDYSLKQKHLSDEQTPFFNSVKRLEIIKIENSNEVFPNSHESEKIYRALLATNNPFTLQRLIDNKISIFIVDEFTARQWTQTDMSAFFIQKHNVIALNQHIFQNWSEKKAEQLITLLANELSHALTYVSNPSKKLPDYETGFMALVPWKNEKDKQAILKAYQNFEGKVDYYNKLIKKSRSGSQLTAAEASQLESFDEEMKNYIPIRNDKSAASCKEEEVVFTDVKTKQYHIVLDKKRKIPSRKNTAARLNYLREEFFACVESRKNMYKLLRSSSHLPAFQNNINQEVADYISDFESLPPGMRKTFGKSLCELLNTYHQINNYCDRPWWPKRA